MTHYPRNGPPPTRLETGPACPDEFREQRAISPTGTGGGANKITPRSSIDLELCRLEGAIGLLLKDQGILQEVLEPVLVSPHAQPEKCFDRVPRAEPDTALGKRIAEVASLAEAALTNNMAIRERVSL